MRKSIWKTTNELTDVTVITFSDLDSSVGIGVISFRCMLRKIVSDVVAVLIQVFYSHCHWCIAQWDHWKHWEIVSNALLGNFVTNQLTSTIRSVIIWVYVRHKLLQMWEAHFKISDNKFNNHDYVVPLQKGMVKEKILIKNFHFKLLML